MEVDSSTNEETRAGSGPGVIKKSKKIQLPWARRIQTPEGFRLVRRRSLPPMIIELPRGSKDEKRTAEQVEPDVDVEDDEPSSKRMWFVDDIE